LTCNVFSNWKYHLFSRILFFVLMKCICFQDIILKIQKFLLNADTIFILAVFMNGWKEAKIVQFVIRYCFGSGIPSIIALQVMKALRKEYYLYDPTECRNHSNCFQ
jgi:hypothetical protein